MRIALAQTRIVQGDVRGNRERVLDAIEQAKKEDADIVVFPETAITGYSNLDRFENDSFILEQEDALKEVGKASRGIVVIIGGVKLLRERDQYNRRIRENSVFVFSNGSLVLRSGKTLLASERYFEDKRYFRSYTGKRTVELDIRGRRVRAGLMVCEDMFDSFVHEKPAQMIKREIGAERLDMIITIAASPFYPGKREERRRAALRQARRFNAPFIYVNTLGIGDTGKNILLFDGSGFILLPDGGILEVPSFKEGVFIHKIMNSEHSKEWRRTSQGETLKGLVYGLREYAQENNFHRAIVGVSGGIDSAVSAVIAVKALGRRNVTLVNLPSEYSKRKLTAASRKLAENLETGFKRIRIDGIYRKIGRDIGVANGITYENLQARTRGIILMGLSNKEKALLINTSNKSETALGYSTLYGDLIGGISILGDIYKSGVFRLAEEINRKDRIIPEETIKAAPDAELRRENSEDPFDYSMVDSILRMILEERAGREEIIKRMKRNYKGKEKVVGVVDDVLRRFRQASFKRMQAPPIISISRRGFGTDFRETIINRDEV